MNDLERIEAAKRAGEWYRQNYSVTGTIDAEVADGPDSDGFLRVILRPRDGSQTVTVGVSVSGEVKLLTDGATRIKRKRRAR